MASHVPSLEEHQALEGRVRELEARVASLEGEPQLAPVDSDIGRAAGRLSAEGSCEGAGLPVPPTDRRTCILLGVPGEDPDDCNTHDHERPACECCQVVSADHATPGGVYLCAGCWEGAGCTETDPDASPLEPFTGRRARAAAWAAAKETDDIEGNLRRTIARGLCREARYRTPAEFRAALETRMASARKQIAEAPPIAALPRVTHQDPDARALLRAAEEEAAGCVRQGCAADTPPTPGEARRVLSFVVPLIPVLFRLADREAARGNGAGWLVWARVWCGLLLLRDACEGWAAPIPGARGEPTDPEPAPGVDLMRAVLGIDDEDGGPDLPEMGARLYG